MNKPVCIKLAFIICSTLICFFTLEITVRMLGRRDEDGNRWFRLTRLKPYYLPIKRVTRMVEEYEVAQSRAAIIYDADLGWSSQPRHDGSNTPGFMSVSTNVDRDQPKDRLRIALVGGSYTADSFESGWWRALGNTLDAAGVKAEVLNFGLGGYSMDQAFLRWRKDVAAYHPHIVIFGFNRVYCEFNLNLLRMIKEPDTGIPFMKPRFLLEGDQLKLLNSPTPSPKELPDIITHFDEWPLAQNERYFNAEDFQNSPWRRSWLLALIEARLGRILNRADDDVLRQTNRKATRLAVKIISQFKHEAETAGSRFYVVHLPAERDLQALRDTGDYPFAELFADINHVATVINPERVMLEATRGKSLGDFFRDGHYTTNTFPRVIGTTVAEALLASPDVERFRRNK